MTLKDYLARITAAHNQQPRFMATVGLTVEPLVEAQNAALSLIGLFDLDTAVGAQLDATGEWIGQRRWIDIPLDIWFTFDHEGLGFDESWWFEPYKAFSERVELDDLHYRVLLKAKVIANYWSGTAADAHAAWDYLLAETGYQVIIQDGDAHHDPHVHGNMHITQAILGPPLDPLMRELFTGGYLDFKSAGVGLDYMIQHQEPGPETGIGLPLFGFDVGPEHPPATFPPTTIAGFDIGAWGEEISGPPPLRPVPPGVPDAPHDGTLYGRTRARWRPALPQEGGQMQGPLEVHPPATDAEAASKDYADHLDAEEY